MTGARITDLATRRSRRHQRALVLRAGTPSLHAARAALGELMPPGEARQDAALLLTELLTNALRHGCGAPEDRVGLRLSLRAGMLRVEVSDPGPRFRPDPSDPGPRATHGRGYLLIDRLASCWGVERTRGGNRAWFELPAGGPAPLPAAA